MSLAASISYAMAVSAKAGNSLDKEIQLDGRILQSALDDLAQHMKKQFTLRGNSTAEIFSSFSMDHGYAEQQDN